MCINKFKKSLVFSVYIGLLINSANVFAGISNGNFSSGLTNWTTTPNSSLPSDFVNLGVTSLAGCTSVDLQDYAVIRGRKGGSVGVAPPSNDNNQPFSATFASSAYAGVIDPGVANPGNVLQLDISGVQVAGYDVVHGPAAVSDAFTINAGEVFNFRWYAKYVSDDFAVTAYLQKTDCSSTVTALVATGANMSDMAPAGSGTGWQTAQVAVPAAGSYRFVFVGGTFDRSGGGAAGAQLFVSGITSGTAQTITFATPASQAVGVPLTLAATASSGLAVSYESTSTAVCTVAGSTVTFLTAGTCGIIATQTGDATFAAAPAVNVSFSVVVGAPVPAPAVQTTGVPTLSEWALILLVGLMGLAGVHVLGRRRS